LTLAAELSGWWTFGWIVAALVVLLAATLLIAAVLLVRRIASQMDDVTAALDGTRANTDGLWEVKQTNLKIHRITRGLALAREALTR
jgi:hypothetical protein